MEEIKDKKYELIPSDREGLYRVKALKDFSDVKKGDIGGYVESEENLSQEGNCWIYDRAVVYDDATVEEDAVVYQEAEVSGNAKVFGSARIHQCAIVYGYARVYGRARVFGDAHVHGNALVSDYAYIFGYASVSNSSTVCGEARVHGYAQICDTAVVKGDANVCEYARIKGNAVVGEKAKNIGSSVIDGVDDFRLFKNWWSSERYFTWTRSNNMWEAGCFYGTGEELIKKAYRDSWSKGRHYEEVVNYVDIAILKKSRIIVWFNSILRKFKNFFYIFN